MILDRGPLRAGPDDDVLWLEVYQADALAASLRAAMAQYEARYR